MYTHFKKDFQLELDIIGITKNSYRRIINGLGLSRKISNLKGFWSRGLVKSRQKNWRESRSRETEVGEKIAVTTTHSLSS